MMTDTPIQQLTDTTGQVLITQAERQALIHKLNSKWAPELSASVEKHVFEKSRGVKLIYLKLIQSYFQQLQNTQQNRLNQLQHTGQLLSHNGQVSNQQVNPLQQVNPSQQTSAPVLNHRQSQLNHMLNQPPRFSSVQQPLPPRLINSATTAMNNNQPTVLNQTVRAREPQIFNQPSLNTISYTPTPPRVQTIDLSQSYTSQQQAPQLNNPNLNDYLAQPSLPQNRYLNQPSSVTQRLRPTMSLTGNFSPQTTSNNANDILHQFVVGNPATNSMTVPLTNTSSHGDRLLQQILLSNNDAASNKTPLQNRQPSLQQPPPTIMLQPTRSASATNSNPNNSVNSLPRSLTSQQTSPSPSVIIMPTTTQTSNVQIQPSSNVTVQQSPLNNSNGPFSTNPQQPSSVPMNNYSSPSNRSMPLIGSGSISSPDEETTNLIKFLRENISKLQTLYQKFTSEGNLDKARNVQAIHQQMVQFINNPTYESLPNAKHIRDMLEKAANRSQPANTSTSNITIPTAPTAPLNEMNQFEKVLIEYITRDPKKRFALNQLFVEPLSDVINGVPHKKVRLDVDTHSNVIPKTKLHPPHQSSLLSNLNAELNLLPNQWFAIEFLPVSHTTQLIELNDEYLSKNGLILRCKLLELSNPLVPPLRLRISTRYPNEPPEILSLTKTMPPKLEHSDGHQFFEQLSTIFVSYLFKLPFQHTVTDILNIWYQSVRSAL